LGADSRKIVDVDLEQLGPSGFQDLAGALAIAAFGPAVQLMGSGPDGGRDLFVDGDLRWEPAESGDATEIWSGRTVFQVKRKDRISDRPQENARWLWSQVREELEAWADPSGRRAVPDYLVIVTNVPLSAVPGSGGHDQLREKIATFIRNLEDDTRDIGDEARDERRHRLARLRRIKGWRFWDRTQIGALMKRHEEVRRAFNAFLTPQDLLAHLAEFTDRIRLDELEPALRAHARLQLTTGDGLVYFDDAGGDTRGMSLHEVLIDLPIQARGGRGSALQFLFNRAAHVLRPSIVPMDGARHLVVVGAPGNGKTTLSKFLVHAFRAAMLEGSPGLSRDHERIIAGSREALRKFGTEVPPLRRWPLRLDLAEYAHEAFIDEFSLTRWAAMKISKSWNDGTLTVQTLNAWTRQWPSLVLLDGLDEVTDPDARKFVLEQIVSLANEAEADRADLLIVVTTRSMGYDDIAPSLFERVDLGYLSTPQALQYGESSIRMRHGNDIDRIERVVGRLHDAADDDGLRDLLRTPLQVLMLTFIVDQTGRLPPDRYSLYYGYYEAILRRERGKPGSISRILQDYEPHIERLHELVGFELQCRSEMAGSSDASLNIDDLRALAARVLSEADYKPEGKDRRVLEEIVRMATHRLVLIASRPDDSGMGFDVRSIQELMAGRFLVSSVPELIAADLRIIAPSPHWRHTWIFSAGALFRSSQEHQRAQLIELLLGLDESCPERLGRVVPVAPRLALDLVEDGMANSYPRHQKTIAAIGLQVLLQPKSPELPWVARTLLRFASLGQDQHHQVAEGIRDALVASAESERTARALMDNFKALFDELGSELKTRSLAAVLPRPGEAVPSEPVVSWISFDEEIATAPVGDPLRLEATAGAAKYIGNGGRWDTAGSDILREGLGDPELSSVLEVAIVGMDFTPVRLQHWLREHYSDANRAPVSHLLSATRAE